MPPEMFALRQEEQCQFQLVEREDFGDEDDWLKKIDNLIAHGINAGDVKKLQDAGIYTCNDLIMLTKKSQLQLVEREDFEDEEDSLEIQKSALCRTTICSISESKRMIARGIYGGEVKNLQDAGIYTCNGLMMHTKKNLTRIKGLSEAKLDMIRKAAETIVNFGYFSGSDTLLRTREIFAILSQILKAYVQRKAVIRITTGSQTLDGLLGGGIETLAITEAFGEFRSGKTQLAHTLCVSTQLPTSMRGGIGKVAYIDIEGTFRPDRTVPIAERFGMDPGALLDNIIYARAYTYEHQYKLLLGLAAKISEEPFTLPIVDSVIALYRVDFSGRGEHAERQQKLTQMLSSYKGNVFAYFFLIAVFFIHGTSAQPMPEASPMPEAKSATLVLEIVAAFQDFFQKNGIYLTIAYLLAAWFIKKFVGQIDDLLTAVLIKPLFNALMSLLKLLLLSGFTFVWTLGVRLVRASTQLGTCFNGVWTGMKTSVVASLGTGCTAICTGLGTVKRWIRTVFTKPKKPKKKGEDDDSSIEVLLHARTDYY